MKRLILLVSVFTVSLVTPQLVSAVEGTTGELNVGSSKVTAQFPDDVSIVFANTENKPTSYEASRGHEDLGIGPKGNFDKYTVEIFDDALAKQHGISSVPTSIEEFISGELAFLGQKYDTVVKQEELPKSLQSAGNETSRYVWITARPKGTKEDPKVLLWRVQLVDGKVILGQREIEPGYIKTHSVDPKNEDEWKFLRSIETSSSKYTPRG